VRSRRKLRCFGGHFAMRIEIIQGPKMLGPFSACRASMDVSTMRPSLALCTEIAPRLGGKCSIEPLGSFGGERRRSRRGNMKRLIDQPSFYIMVQPRNDDRADGFLTHHRVAIGDENAQCAPAFS
jgi:hypothetical protein